jgi:predicted nucleic acid-binding protein
VRAVVSDTGPLHYLVLIEKIEILPRLFTTVLVPLSVRAELDRPETPASVRAWVAEPPGLAGSTPRASSGPS